MAVVTNKYRGTKEYLLVYCELINAARHRGTVTYQEIAEIMGLPVRGAYMGKETGHILGEVSEDEHMLNRPMLSAVAVGVSSKPGPGFFKLARELGKLQSSKEEDEQEFWKIERAAAYAVWQKNFKETED